MKLTGEDIQQIVEALTPFFVSIDNRLGSIESRMEGLESRMDSLESRMDSLESRMDKLEFKVDKLIRQNTKEHAEMNRLINVSIAKHVEHNTRFIKIENHIGL